MQQVNSVESSILDLATIESAIGIIGKRAAGKIFISEEVIRRKDGNDWRGKMTNDRDGLVRHHQTIRSEASSSLDQLADPRTPQ